MLEFPSLMETAAEVAQAEMETTLFLGGGGATSEHGHPEVTRSNVIGASAVISTATSSPLSARCSSIPANHFRFPERAQANQSRRLGDLTCSMR